MSATVIDVPGTKLHADPQTEDPLAEPTLQRRMWSAYLRAGYTRPSFAKALGVSYQTVINIDTGKTTPELGTLLRACVLVKYTPDQLIYGHNPPEFAARDALSPEEVSRVWHVSGAPFESLRALHEVKHGPGGEYLMLTRAFVAAYVAAFARVFDRARPASYDAAKEHALIAATQGDNVAAAVDLGAVPITPAKRRRKVRRAAR